MRIGRVAVAALLCACGGSWGGGPSGPNGEFCREWAQSSCHRTYECTPVAERDELFRALFGTSEAQCTGSWTMYCTTGMVGTATSGVACQAGKTVDAAKKKQCLDRLSSATCAEIDAPDYSDGCDQVCGVGSATDGGDGGGTDGSGGGETAAGDAAADGGADAPATWTALRLGQVNSLDVGNAAGPTMSAVFTETAEQKGACWVQSVDGTTSAPSPHAGEITITDLTRTATLTPDSYGLYRPVNLMGKWAGTAPLTVRAAGSAVPAFEAMGVVIQPGVTVTSPAISAGFRIVRAAGLTLTWTGGSSGMVRLAIESGVASRKLLGCEFPASAGRGDVPADTLMKLERAFGSGDSLLYVVGVDVKNVMAGAWTVKVAAGTRALTSGGGSTVVYDLVIE